MASYSTRHTNDDSYLVLLRILYDPRVLCQRRWFIAPKTEVLVVSNYTHF